MKAIDTATEAARQRLAELLTILESEQLEERAALLASAAVFAAAPHIITGTLRALAKEARTRGDIGKFGGVEAWTFLEWHAERLEAGREVGPTAPCQVADPSIATRCFVTDSAGVRCENPEPHDTEHWISAHTIDHSCMGNGYSCGDIAVRISRDELQFKFQPVTEVS